MTVLDNTKNSEAIECVEGRGRGELKNKAIWLHLGDKGKGTFIWGTGGPPDLSGYWAFGRENKKVRIRLECKDKGKFIWRTRA